MTLRGEVQHALSFYRDSLSKSKPKTRRRGGSLSFIGRFVFDGVPLSDL